MQCVEQNNIIAALLVCWLVSAAGQSQSCLYLASTVGFVNCVKF
jgi:hypothetical protein